MQKALMQIIAFGWHEGKGETTFNGKKTRGDIVYFSVS